MKTVAALLLLAAAALQSPQPLDSQIVIQRYAKRLLTPPSPKVLVFSYTVSQAGPRAIEQTHRIYRSGDLVRDETLMDDGLKTRRTVISRYRNRYSVENLAPRLTQYAFLFEGLRRSGSTLQYEYRAIPSAPQSGFTVDSMVLDGKTFLPVMLSFHAASSAAGGKGTVTFARSGKYWVPTTASVEGRVHGKAARERIVFSAYRFPLSLPKSTFQPPKLLPTATATP